MTGVVKKPLNAASQSNGSLPVLKEFGVGIVGLTMRPTTGVFDFASQGLEGIRRYLRSHK